MWIAVIPAQAGIPGQDVSAGLHEIPASAGMTELGQAPGRETPIHIRLVEV
jgi:hypothetical protein